MKKESGKRDVEIAFARLIGPLSTISALESYEEDRPKYERILSVIVRWSAEYFKTRRLSNIKAEDILNIYNELDELKGKWLFKDNIGIESELSDEVVIWIWELMNLRKNEIEGAE